MNVEPFVLASVLRLSVAQRLIRTLCPNCASPRMPTASEQALFASELGTGRIPDRLFEATGCSTCDGSGYRGRTLVIEAVPVTPDLQALIRDRASDAELVAQAKAEGVTTLFQHGLGLAAGGVTSLDEVLRAADARIETLDA